MSASESRQKSTTTTLRLTPEEAVRVAATAPSSPSTSRWELPGRRAHEALVAKTRRQPPVRSSPSINSRALPSREGSSHALGLL
ncbi:hypothetical protein [Microvirga tunisiensis]|uniref:Uncharacterized protein n=1 Tax=Microvirga tunisiensis TaxID=2108360 RepID=A0A5N7MUT7_9HYPH|nr:hypothetical protein [Microvirga tunisiensis]MPR06182.1 hypothetical protein [Microvirga tunisiensis]MPR30711.1 hypothetical protein [Microvirga tunisiensis]